MEDFVPFEIAKKLKEKGFPQRPDYFNYSSYYDWDGLRKIHSLCNASVWFDANINRDNIYFAPIISQVLKWLRNTRKLFISPCVITDYQDDFHRDTTDWSFIVVNIESGDSIYREYERVTEKRYETYEQAALAGIDYCLDNLI